MSARRLKGETQAAVFMETQNNEISLDDLTQAETQANKKLEIQERFGKLSEKMTLTAKERDEAQAKIKTEAEARTKAEKERDFFRDFSKLSGQYQGASEYQDKILEKVNAGYSTEDATLAVLAKEGKLGGQVKPITAQTQNPAGGSAATSMTDFDKSPEEMNQEERRKALTDLEKNGMNLLKF